MVVKKDFNYSEWVKKVKIKKQLCSQTETTGSWIETPGSFWSRKYGVLIDISIICPSYQYQESSPKFPLKSVLID